MDKRDFAGDPSAWGLEIKPGVLQEAFKEFMAETGKDKKRLLVHKTSSVDYGPQAVNDCVEYFDIVKFDLHDSGNFYWVPEEEYKKEKRTEKIVDSSSCYEGMVVCVETADFSSVGVAMQEEEFGDDNYLEMSRKFFEKHFSDGENKMEGSMKKKAVGEDNLSSAPDQNQPAVSTPTQPGNTPATSAVGSPEAPAQQAPGKDGITQEQGPDGKPVDKKPQTPEEQAIKILQDAIKKVTEVLKKPGAQPGTTQPNPNHPQQQKAGDFQIQNKVRFKNDVPALNIVANTVGNVIDVESNGAIKVQVPDGRQFRIQKNEFGEIEKVD